MSRRAGWKSRRWELTTWAIPVSGIAPLWREHGHAFGVLALSTTYILTVGIWHPQVTAPLWHLPSALLLVVVVADLALVRIVWERIRTRDPWRVVWTRLRDCELATERLWGVFLAGFMGRWLMLNAVGWKLTIPLVHPFAFDARLSRIDFALHGGDPARLPMPDLFLRAIDAFYYGWFPIFAAAMLWWGWQAPSALRRRFLLGMALMWTLSAVGAVLVSSAGPVFYGHVTGEPSPYVHGVARLRDLDLIAYGMQEAVWNAYLGSDTGVIAGIAAFPSVHVALPALLALSSWGWLRWMFWGMCIVTLVGSFSLQWHYAVDGYAGVGIAWVSWRLAR